jgi:hypothetical protein
MLVMCAAGVVSAAYRIPGNVSISGVADPTPGVQVTQRVIYADTEWCYLVWLPPDYNPDGSELWPMIVFYGPACDTYGNNGGDITIFFTANFDNGGPAKYMQASECSDYPFIANRFIVVSPFVHYDIFSPHHGQSGRLKGLHNHLMETYKIDPARVSMQGYCWGGGVVWNYCGSDPTFAKRTVLISCNDTWSSTCDLSLACNLKDVWMLHYAAQSDPMVPYENQVAMHTALDGCCLAPRRDSLITLNSGAHECWLWDNIANTAPIYDWMLQGGTTPVAQEQSGRPAVTLSLGLDTQLSPKDRLQVLNPGGRLLHNLSGNGSTAGVLMPELNPGTYILRITSGDETASRVFLAR